jgi:hypothetical protein
VSYSLEFIKLGDCFQRGHGIDVKSVNFISQYGVFGEKRNLERRFMARDLAFLRGMALQFT